MEGIITYKSYREYKAELDTELRKSAEGFVRIGYLLKQARDTDILKESGYANVNEFARAEYNIDKTMVSRFIGINDRFSEGGNSPQLKEQYRDFGYSKLAVMLQLPDSINEELSPAFSKSEIQTIKEEYDSEMKTTDLEVLMEEKPERQQDMEDDLSKAVWQLGHDNPELYKEIHDAAEDATFEALQEALAPAGEGIYSVRVPGTGRLLVSVKGTDRDITLTNIRTGEKRGYGWDLLYRAVYGIIRTGYEAEKSWELVYHEPFPAEKEPEKPKVAPVQPKTEDKKPARKKQPKVTKAKTEEKPVNTQSEVPGTAPEIQREEEKETETVSAEALQAAEPTGDKAETIENVTGISIVTETPLGGMEPDNDVPKPKKLDGQYEYNWYRTKYIDKITNEFSAAQNHMESGNYLQAKERMEKTIEIIDRLSELDRKNEGYFKRWIEDEQLEKLLKNKEDDEDADEQ